MYKTFNLIKKVLILVLMSVSSVFMSQKYVSLKNKECKVRKVIVDNEYMSFPYKIEVNRCVGSCNNINNPYSKVCIPDVIKNVTAKMFDFINLTNTKKQIEFRKSCKCICKINASACSENKDFANAHVSV